MADKAYDPNSELHKRLFGHSYRHPGNICYLLVCRVILGYPMRMREPVRHLTAQGVVHHRPTSLDGNGELVFPRSERELAPIAGVTPPVLHHSLIVEQGGLLNMRYREFVVFHGEYVRPEYLVAYQRCQGGIANLS